MSPAHTAPSSDGLPLRKATQGTRSQTTHVPIEVATQLTAIQPKLFGFLLKRLASREQADEVLQKTNLAICENAERFTLGTNFDAWAITVARFQLMAWRKTSQRDRLVFNDFVLNAIDQATDTSDTIFDDRVTALRTCLKKLKSKDLELIHSRYHDAADLANLARSLRKSVDAIGMKLSRIRRQLAACIRQTLETTQEVSD